MKHTDSFQSKQRAFLPVNHSANPSQTTAYTNDIDPNNFFEKMSYENLFSDFISEGKITEKTLGLPIPNHARQSSNKEFLAKKEATHSKTQSTPSSKVQVIKINKYMEEYYNQNAQEIPEFLAKFLQKIEKY